MSYRALRLQFTTMLTIFAFLFATMAPPRAGAASAKPAPPQNPNKTTHSLISLVQGTATDTTGAVAGTAAGILTVTSFQVVHGVLNAVGTITGTITPTTGSVQTFTQSFTVPVASLDPSCQILNLVLGPLNLSLLGLNVSLNQVVLTITAVPGAGNLLGNLLCDVANLLNSGGTLTTLLNNLVSVLNQIISAL